LGAARAGGGGQKKKNRFRGRRLQHFPGGLRPGGARPPAQKKFLWPSLGAKNLGAKKGGGGAGEFLEQENFGVGVKRGDSPGLPGGVGTKGKLGGGGWGGGGRDCNTGGPGLCRWRGGGGSGGGRGAKKKKNFFRSEGAI